MNTVIRRVPSTLLQPHTNESSDDKFHISKCLVCTLYSLYVSCIRKYMLFIMIWPTFNLCFGYYFLIWFGRTEKKAKFSCIWLHDMCSQNVIVWAPKKKSAAPCSVQVFFFVKFFVSQFSLYFLISTTLYCWNKSNYSLIVVVVIIASVTCIRVCCVSAAMHGELSFHGDGTFFLLALNWWTWTRTQNQRRREKKNDKTNLCWDCWSQNK